MDRDESKDKDGLPMLTMDNWSSEFRDDFLNLAIRYGDAGEILTKRVDIPCVKPDYDSFTLTQGPEGQAGQVVRKYNDDATGWRKFERDEKKYDSLLANKKFLISKLVSRLDTKVKNKVTGAPGWKAAYDGFNLLQVWLIVEEVVLGSGSISGYQLITRLIKLKQEGDYSEYCKTFVEAVTNLLKQGDTAEAILVKIVDTLFVLGLNHEQFKEKLTPIYGSKEWPHYQDLSAELYTYSEAIRGMEEINGDHGKISVNMAESNDYKCYNCGSSDHLKRDCPHPLHLCTVCGKKGHMESGCRDRTKKAGRKPHGSDKPREQPRKSNPRSGGGAPTKKMSGKFKTLKKAMVAMLERAADSSDDEDESDGNEIGANTNQDSESDDDDATNRSYMIRVSPQEAATPFEALERVCRAAHQVLVAKEAPETLIMDTGSPSVHVFTEGTEELLANSKPKSRELFGIGGHAVKSKSVGTLGKNGGRGMTVPESEASVLSVFQIISNNGGSFRGDMHTLDIMDRNGDTVLTGYNNGDGFWRSSLQDVRKFACLMAINLDSEPEDVEPPPQVLVGDLDAPPELAHDDSDDEDVKPIVDASMVPPLDVPVLHLTSEEMNRARLAHNLCAQLGHPGFRRIMKALDNNMYESNLTSQDVRNGLSVYGDCVPCLVSKMRADPVPKASDTPPAPTIGHMLHCDIVPLQNISIGGNKFLLFAVDEKSGFINGVSMPNKGKPMLCKSFDTIFDFYKLHTGMERAVQKVRTDHESNLISCKEYFNSKMIDYSAGPAGSHEKMAERNIQSTRTRKLCIENTLPYELPKDLEAEAWHAAIAALNSTPNKRSGAYTPYQLVTKRRPPIPKFHFGQSGVFHYRRPDTPNQRTEWGIFLGNGDGPRHYRGYLPMRRGVYSLRKFVPHPEYPREWNFKARIRPPEPRHVKLEPQLEVKTESQLLDVAPQPLIANQESVSQGFPKVPGVVQRQHQHPVIPPRPAESVDPRFTAESASPQTVIPSRVPAESAGHRLTAESAGPRFIAEIARPLPVVAPPAPMASAPAPAPIVVEGPVPPVLRAPLVAPPGRVTRRSAVAASAVSLPASVPEPEPPPADPVGRPSRKSAKSDWKDGPVKLRNYMVRLLNDPHGPLVVYAYRISLRKALKDKERRKSALQAVHGEIKNMEDGDVLDFLLRQHIPHKERKHIIPAHLFLTDKFKADGAFDKVKARLVANGDRQDPDSVGDTYSPTVNQISVFTQLNLAAATGAHLSAYDIKGAFLVTPIDSKREKIYLRIPPEVSAQWISLFPARAAFLSEDGCLYASLKKYIYGLQEASHEFNNLLHRTLLKMGFRASKADRCIYVKNTHEGIVIASTHVDDILLSAPTLELRGWFETQLEASFQIVRQYGDLSYLGMRIQYDREKKQIRVSQSGSVRDIVVRHGCGDLRKFPATPATAAITTPDAGSPACDKTAYLSLVMTLMYIARLTRPDILYAVTLLATRSARPTESDSVHLRRIVRYLAGTPDIGIVFDGTRPVIPAIYADASHITHPDGLSQAGIIITLGSAPILSRSFKIKLVTRSSSESELFALEEASTYAGWLKLLLLDLGAPCAAPITTYQDNTSTIVMAMQGGHFKKIKHMLVRIEQRDIVLRYLPTAQMPADILTKSLSQPIATPHLHKLCVK